MNEVEQNKPKTQFIPPYERKIPERNGQDKITLPDNLPIERQIIDLSEEEKVCKETGLPLIKIGEEITRKLAFRIGSHFIKEIVRIKYALPKSSQGGILTGPLPETFLDRCQADESFLSDMLVKKYCDH